MAPSPRLSPLLLLLLAAASLAAAAEGAVDATAAAAAAPASEASEAASEAAKPPPQPHTLVALTAKTFDSATAEGLWIIEFYAPWCAHCKALAGPWEELARRHRKEPRLRIAKVDATRHEVPHPRVKLEGYPTVLLFGAGRAAKDAPVELRERTVAGFERALAAHLPYKLQPTEQKLSSAPPAPPTPQPEEPTVWSYGGDTASRIFKHAVKHHAILLFDSRLQSAALREETEKARASFGFRAADARRAAAGGAPRVLYIEVDLAAGGDVAQEKKRAKLAAFLGMGAATAGGEREKALGLAVVAMGSKAMDVFRYGGGWRKADMESFERQYHAGELTPLQRGKKKKTPEKKAVRVEL